MLDRWVGLIETNYSIICYGIMAAGFVAVIVLLFGLDAPYGRYSNENWGMRIPGKWAWILMESAALFSFLIVYLNLFDGGFYSVILGSMFAGHYAYRSFVFPIRMRAAKPKPLIIMLIAIAFNIANGAVIGVAASKAANLSLDVYLIPLLIGGAMFAFGMWLNLDSDARLRNLRMPGETGYKIPYGGGFKFVSSPNYFGELIEWAGFAIASMSLAGASFAFFTLANLGPRALSHHRWYKANFDDYPKDRKALIPGLI